MSNQVLEVGLTGGIGSGKSTVARIFETLGYRVYSADDRAKAMYREDATVIREVKSLFGADIFRPDGSLNRAKLAQTVFSDRAKLAQLNALVHPATLRDFARWRIQLRESGYAKPFLLKEAAILFEAGSDRELGATLAVYAPKQVRLARVTARDKSDPAQVLARMDNQWSDLRKVQRSDFVIYNDGQHPVIPQVRAAERFFQAIATQNADS
ncbi:MAG: dephospho-CoA kinase [Bacteroidota bacterium]